MLAALVRHSARRPGVVLALALLLLAFGAWRLSQAGLDIFPEFAGKRAIVQTEAPGLTPEQVETLVTRQVEKSLAGLPGLSSLRSESLQGLSVVVALFEENTDIYRDRQQIGERLAGLQGQLPPGIGPPLLTPLSSSSATVLTIGLSSPSHDEMELRTLADWTLAPRLMATPGVADVNVFGGQIKQLQIRLRPDALRRYGLSLDEVRQAAEAATGTRGAGFLENENQRIPLQLTGLPADTETLRQTVLLRKNGVNVTFGDIAEIAHGPRPPIGQAAIGGESAIVMMVIGQYGANTLNVSRRVESVLEEFREILGKRDIRLNPRLFRPADYIERSIRNLSGHLLAGGLLVVSVLYVFLFDARAAFIPALAIPLSLLSAIVTLLALDVNLNLMVLGGLAISLGEVVDDAIIDVENIFRRLRENRLAPMPKPVAQVVFSASMEVRGSVVYATFIVALSFVPLLTLGGVAGRLFSPLGQAYILAILASLLAALTVTPALCCLLLARRDAEAERSPALRRILPGYETLLRRAAAAPGKTLGISALILSALLTLAPKLGGEFLPRLREGHFIVHTVALPGTSLPESLRMGSQLAREFAKIDGVESVSQWAGRAERGADTYGPHYSEYEVRLEPMNGIGQQAALERLRAILGDFPGLDYEANTFLTERIDETISGYTAPVAINVYGADLDRLDAKAHEIAELMKSLEGAREVRLRSPPAAPMLQVRLLPERLASYGIRPLEAAEAAQTAYEGRIVGHYFERDRAIEVNLILAPEHRRRVESVAALPLRAAEGGPVELGRLADIRQIEARYNILHRNGQRVQTVTCNVAGRDLDSFLQELKRRVLGEIGFPADMHPEFAGASVEQAQARRELIAHALLTGAGILLLTYIAIGGLRNTFITLVNLPFSLAGGLLGALVAGTELSVGAMMGFIALFGVTMRNAIMLISHYRRLVEIEGHTWSLETVVRGARERLPSILMTATVTALAMAPIAFDSDNPGREIMGPMAAIVVGGLASSTLLNLLLLPTILWRYGKFAGSRAHESRA